MSKWAIAMTGLALLGMSSGASAKDKLEPRTQAMLACQGLAADSARLQCYDQAMAALKEAIDQGAVRLDGRDGRRGAKPERLRTSSRSI